MASFVKEEAGMFVKSTSIKGLKRAFYSDSIVIRLFWLLFVIVFAGWALCQTYYLVSIYFTYPVITSVEEASVFQAPYNKEVLPKVMICNQDPIGPDVHQSEVSPTLEEYFASVDAKFKCGFDSNNDSRLPVDVCELSKAQLKSPGTYAQYIGLSNAFAISHKTLIVSCKQNVIFGTRHLSMSCGGLVNLEDFFSMEFYKCTQFRISDSYSLSYDMIINGFELLLFVGQSPNVTFSSTALKKGVKVKVSELDFRISGNDLVHNSLSLSPGTDVIIDITPSKRLRLQEPHGSCRKYEGDNSLPGCINDCIAQAVKKECGCIEIVSLLSADSLTSAGNNVSEFCLSLHSTNETIITNVNCVLNATASNQPMCSQSCKAACEDMAFGTAIHSNSWPQADHLHQFYRQHIANTSLESYLPNLQAYTNCTSDCAFLQMKALQEVQSTFLRVSFALQNNNIYIFKDVPKQTWTQLWSNIGGILNLWSGITLLVLLELLEFLYRLLVKAFKKRKVETETIESFGQKH